MTLSNFDCKVYRLFIRYYLKKYLPHQSFKIGIKVIEWSFLKVKSLQVRIVMTDELHNLRKASSVYHRSADRTCDEFYGEQRPLRS